MIAVKRLFCFILFHSGLDLQKPMDRLRIFSGCFTHPFSRPSGRCCQQVFGLHFIQYRKQDLDDRCLPCTRSAGYDQYTGCNSCHHCFRLFFRKAQLQFFFSQKNHLPQFFIYFRAFLPEWSQQFHQKFCGFHFRLVISFQKYPVYILFPFLNDQTVHLSTGECIFDDLSLKTNQPLQTIHQFRFRKIGMPLSCCFDQDKADCTSNSCR